MSWQLRFSVRESSFGKSAVACRRCGCRMVTKVGHARPMLICTDCGLPLDQRETSAMARQRLWGALWLVVMALVSGAILLLAMSYESRLASPLDESLERTDAGSDEEAKREKENLLLEPSTLVKPADAGSGRGERAPAEGFNATASPNGAIQERGAPPQRPPALSGSTDR
jgi:hypothetical protein